MNRPKVTEIMDELLVVDPEYGKKVSEFRIAIGEDSLGQDAIFVTLVLEDSAARTAWPNRDGFRKSVEDRLFQKFPDYFPYVRVSAQWVALDPEAVPAA